MNKKINVSELDFDSIKDNLKEFLKGQSEFQDYNFEGSAMSTMLDILAYNTHYNALYQNLTINELFLDSAFKRDSVVSIAKMLGYTPRSARSAKALISLSIQALDDQEFLTIPKFSLFTGYSSNNKYYNFYNIQSYIAKNISGTFNIDGIELVEGTYIQDLIEIEENKRYLINNRNIDLTTLQIYIQENLQNTNIEAYSNATNIINLDENSKVYFIKEIENGSYEITFGDGILGYTPSNGSIINLSYIISSLTEPNGIKSFSIQSISNQNYNVSTTTLSSASGGSEKESIESIKYNASYNYSSQNRAVTVNDYKTIILNNFSNIDNVSVWGGEDNNPPEYGKVFISPKPKYTEVLTVEEKNNILNLLNNNKSIVTIEPKIVDAEYTEIILDIVSYYYPDKTNLTNKDITNLIINGVNTFNTTYLTSFDSIFKYSIFNTYIDKIDKSLSNSIINLKIKKEIKPKYNINANYILNLKNPIYNGNNLNLYSNGFYILGSEKIHYLSDDGIGNIILYNFDDNGNKIKITNVGIVNYITGYVNITKLNITQLTEETLYFYIIPLSNDIITYLNNIITINLFEMKVETIPIGSKYIISSSRG